MSLLLAAAGAASAHRREENPRLAEHAEGRGRRRPSRGCRAPSLRPPRSPCILSPQRPSLEPSLAERGPASRLHASATARAPSSSPGSPAAFTSRRGLVPQPGGPAPRAPERRKPASARPREAPPPRRRRSQRPRSPRPAPPRPAGEHEGVGSSLGTVAG